MLGCNCAAQKNAKLLTEIPFRIVTGGVIIIEARIDSVSEPLHFVLDSGSGGISLDSTACAAMGIIPQVSDTTIAGIAGRKKVPYLFNRKLFLPGLVIEKLNYYVNDYSVLSSIYGERIDGIIGYPLFSKFILAVDFDTAGIKIFSPGKFGYAKGTTLHPRIDYLAAQQLSVSDRRKVSFDFYLDSGAGLCFLMNEQFAKDSNIITAKRKRYITQSEGLGGKTQMQLTVVKQLKVGPYKFRNVPTYIYDDKINITNYPETGGLLGNDLMRRFNMVYNYPAGEINIAPNTHYNDDFDYAYTGLSLYKTADGIFAEDVVPASPAAKAGIKTDDEIVGIDEDFSGKFVQYISLLQKLKGPVSLLVKREGSLRILTIEPVSILR